MTGLPNRPYFIDRMARHIKTGTRGGYTAILFLGLDQFKLINDAIGHATGDILLQSVAKRLKALTSDHVFVARTGGDEFSVLLPGVDAEQAMVIGERVRQSVCGTTGDGTDSLIQIPIEISMGVADLQPNGTLDSLTRDADAALYRAKHAGRNIVSR